MMHVVKTERSGVLVRGPGTALRRSFGRLIAMIIKELHQMRRDALTFATMIGIPIAQIIMFGYAVNMDPHHLPTAVVIEDRDADRDNVVSILQTTGYFQVTSVGADAAAARRLMQAGRVKFVVRVPPNFTHDLFHGARPHAYVDADGTDPVAIVAPLAALARLPEAMARSDDSGQFNNNVPPFDVVVRRAYNSNGDTATSIVPGLIGLILTQTMVLITALAMTREVERGTIEGLLAAGLSPVEIMLGKMLPYVGIGYAQVLLVLVAAPLLFHVPMLGSYALLLLASTLFIFANLAVGFVIATICRSQFQAMQASFFFFLPSVMLTGFMFPFSGMPHWAQLLGEALPNTHFLRIARGVMLKGNTFADLWPSFIALGALTFCAIALSFVFYRRRLA
jgi:ABC-2 type transport system permease protein